MFSLKSEAYFGVIFPYKSILHFDTLDTKTKSCCVYVTFFAYRLYFILLFLGKDLIYVQMKTRSK